MPYPIERYLNIRSAMGGTFRPNGQRLAFLTDITGTHQIWAVDIPPPGRPTPWPDQLTFFKERVLSVTYSPVADEMIFSTDVGSNERAQLFLLPGDAGPHTPFCTPTFRGLRMGRDAAEPRQTCESQRPVEGPISYHDQSGGGEHPSGVRVTGRQRCALPEVP
jgi:hypothetical protein